LLSPALAGDQAVVIAVCCGPCRVAVMGRVIASPLMPPFPAPPHPHRTGLRATTRGSRVGVESVVSTIEHRHVVMKRPILKIAGGVALLVAALMAVLRRERPQ